MKVKRVCVACGRAILRSHKYEKKPEGLRHRVCEAPRRYFLPDAEVAWTLYGPAREGLQ